MFGFLAPDNRLYTYSTEENINGEFVVKCIDNFVEKMDKPTVIVLDNAPVHRCDILYERINEWQEKDLYIFFLPKYSPHLNIIEILWRFIKYQWLKPKHFLSWGRLKKAINYILLNFGNEFFINFNKTNFN